MALFALLVGGISACAAPPGLRMDLPGQIDINGKAIAIVGDLQQTSAFVRFVRRREDTRAAQRALIADLRSRTADLAALVVVGDLVYTAQSLHDWQHFDTLMAGIADHISVLPAIGNHDYPCILVMLCRTRHMARAMADRFPWLVPGEPYSVDAGALLLLFLDSESNIAEQAQWLTEQLGEAASSHSAVLVFFHRPPWTNSIDRTATGNAAIEAAIVGALRESTVPTIVFNGHVHGFEHFATAGLNFITTAGGGGPRVAMPRDSADASMPDSYAGPECRLEEDGATVRPFNYVMLQVADGQIEIEVLGMCSADEPVRTLYSTSIAL